MDRFPITSEGYKNLEVELKTLKTVDRPAVIRAISEAREHGDLSENAEYAAAKEKQSFIEGRIKELEDIMARADIIDVTSLSGSKVMFGATVKLEDEDSGDEVEYMIVSEYEADLNKGRISLTAPIARALIGKRIDDSVEVKTPRGSRYYTILDVSFRPIAA